MTRPFFSGRIPQSLYNALEEYRQQTNESKTDILIKALSNYVNHPIERPTVLSEIGAERIETLEKKFEILERELRDLRSLFADQLDTSTSKQDRKEKIDQIPLDLQDVIVDDNNLDNILSSNDEDEEVTTQDFDNEIDNINDNKEESLSHGVFLGTLKTIEVLKLPGLEQEDPKKLKNKVSNTKQSKDQTAQIGFYTIVLSKRPETPGRKRQELFWDVYKNQNVIGFDNVDDN